MRLLIMLNDSVGVRAVWASVWNVVSMVRASRSWVPMMSGPPGRC